VLLQNLSIGRPCSSGTGKDRSRPAGNGSVFRFSVLVSRLEGITSMRVEIAQSGVVLLDDEQADVLAAVRLPKATSTPHIQSERHRR
jgi:hypothetical protein